MHYRFYFFTIFFVFSVGLWGWLYFSDESDMSLPVVPVERVIIYSFSIKNTTNEYVDKVTFSGFAPLLETPFQRLTHVHADESFARRIDGDGHTFLDFELVRIPPYGVRRISVIAKLEMWEKERQGFHYSYEDHFELRNQNDDEFWIRDVLTEINFRVRNAPGKNSAQIIYSWVVESMRDTGYSSVFRGVRYALEQREGDCSEFAAAMTYILRRSGYMAYTMSGFRAAQPATVIRATDQHEWVIWNDENWRVSDPHGRIHDRFADEYIAFRRDDSVVSGGRPIMRFQVSDPRLRVSLD